MELGFAADFFNPATSGGTVDGTATLVTVHGRNGRPSYVYNRSIILAVNLARATRRPLFIGGRPGTGKSTLAANVAALLGWKFYQRVVTSRTRARDLMWTFDSLRRLSHAQERGKTLPPRAAYVQPDVLWWAFEPDTARWRGASKSERKLVTEAQDRAVDMGASSNVRLKGRADSAQAPSAVVLLDEIDKADPDVPNDLLEVLDVGSFTVDELDRPHIVQATPDRTLVMLTSNGERELPPAFLRRCVVLQLEDPTEDWLVAVANDRFGPGNDVFHREIARRVMDVRAIAESRDLRAPSTAEYLDAVAACQRLGISADSDTWALVSSSLLWKREKEAGVPL